MVACHSVKPVTGGLRQYHYYQVKPVAGGLGDISVPLCQAYGSIPLLSSLQQDGQVTSATIVHPQIRTLWPFREETPLPLPKLEILSQTEKFCNLFSLKSKIAECVQGQPDI